MSETRTEHTPDIDAAVLALLRDDAAVAVFELDAEKVGFAVCLDLHSYEVALDLLGVPEDGPGQRRDWADDLWGECEPDAETFVLRVRAALAKLD